MCISKISKQQNIILKMWNEGGNDNQCFIQSKRNYELNEPVYSFFVRCRAKNFPVFGPLLQEYDLKIAKNLSVEDFKASNGWLESFRSRHCILFRSLSGEGADTNTLTIQNWKSKIPEICKGYSWQHL